MATFTLNTGQTVPVIGFGTWEISPNDATKEIVLTALEAGYRVIDTAKIYGNEQGVGEAIRESGIPRNELFITTKLWNDDQGFDSTLAACSESLERLGLDYLDLYLIHWPATKKRHMAWEAFEKLVEQGTIKAAGVSNYTVAHLEELLERSELVPAVNQVEFHPFIYEEQRTVLHFCRKHDILLEAYSPLNRVQASNSPVIATIAATHKKSIQQVVLRWCIQHGTLPIPRSTSQSHITDNVTIQDFILSDEDMQQLDKLNDGQRVTWDPAGMG